MKTIIRFTIILFVTFYFQGTNLLATQVNSDRQARQISGFHGVSVSSGIDLYLIQKDVEEVFVEAKSDELDKIITTVEEGILKIYIKEKSFFGLNWSNGTRKVYVSFKTLSKLRASAGSDVFSQSVFKLDKLDLQASSGSDIKLELEANELNVETSSGSDISLKGKATVIQADASSGSDINAFELETKKCTASVSSGSDIEVNVTEELDANASSGGDIEFTGNPKSRNVHESSGGDVHGK